MDVILSSKFIPKIKVHIFAGEGFVNFIQKELFWDVDNKQNLAIRKKVWLIRLLLQLIVHTLVCTMQWKHSFSPESSPKQCRQIFETQLVGYTSSFSLLSPCYRIRRHFLWRSAKILNTMFAEKIEDWSFTCLHGDDDVAPRCCRNHLVCMWRLRTKLLNNVWFMSFMHCNGKWEVVWRAKTQHFDLLFVL